MKITFFARLNKRPLKSADATLADLRKQNADRIDRIAAIRTPMAKASIFLDRWVQSNFKTEGGKVGGWEPFALGGRATKSGIDATATLLQDTGRLRASFAPFHSNKDAGIGSDLAYSELHHKGLGVPERRLLPEKNDVLLDVRRIMRNHVVDALKVK